MADSVSFANQLLALWPSGRSQVFLQLTDALARGFFGIPITLPLDFGLSEISEVRPIGYLYVALRIRLRCEKGWVWSTNAQFGV